jgi:hypothetical protein
LAKNENVLQYRWFQLSHCELSIYMYDVQFSNIWPFCLFCCFVLFCFVLIFLLVLFDNINNIVSYIYFFFVIKNHSSGICFFSSPSLLQKPVLTVSSKSTLKTAWMHSLFNHLEFWIFNAIQCRTSFCFQICLNKRVSGEYFCRRNTGQVLWIYAWNFDLLHSFDIKCNADDAQT